MTTGNKAVDLYNLYYESNTVCLKLVLHCMFTGMSIKTLKKVGYLPSG